MSLTDEERHEVIVSMYASTYSEIYEKIVSKKWTEEMFVLFCREQYQEGVEGASNEACL